MSVNVPPADREIYSVSRLNREARTLLERQFPVVWIEGEISNVARPASGHLYFSLKDSTAQLRCAMFRSRNTAVAFALEDGLQVLARGRISLFEPRGDFQLIVDHLEPAGEGLLRLAFERLRAKLAGEGLFDPDRKRPLPPWPQQIGVVTSPSGAAIRDVLAVLKRRCPMLPVVVYPTPVQGDSAAPQIVRAIEVANARAECDVLILTRGGGSLEDLWPFNEERVARAVAASEIPIVCGVGHEVDVTIAELVADLRAPTPSAAAELVSPDQTAIAQHVIALLSRLQRSLAGRLERLGETVDWYERRLPQPAARLRELAARLGYAGERLPRAIEAGIAARRYDVADLNARLHAHHPRNRLALAAERQAQLLRRLQLAWERGLADASARLKALSRALTAVSPLATLGRGYAIVRTADGNVARRAADFAPGDRVSAELQEGRLACVVEEIESER